MLIAIEEARKTQGDVPVGCVIVHNNELIGRGYNQREACGDPTAHAEIVAIRQAAGFLGRWRLSETTVYTTLEPCPMCAEAIIQARVARLVFGAYDIRFGATGSAFNLFCKRRPYPIPEVIGGIEEGQCQKMLIEFFQLRR